MKTILLTLFIVLCGLFHFETSTAQDAGNPISNRGYYRTMNMFGAYLHTAGVGGYYRRGWRQTGFSNKILNIELLSLNHPKQTKIDAQGSQDYYLGKINSVGMLRASWGYQKTWFDKEVKRGVRVSTFFLFGPSIAFAKPIYMKVRYPDDQVATEPYDYDKHNQGVEIIGKANYLLGVDETRFYPGLHVKGSLNFEYSGDDEMIRAIETGITFDGFAKEIPIMANTYNDQFYLTLYVGFHFGKRYL